MMLTVEQATKIAEGQGSKAKRAATTDPNYYWDPSTPIYYTIDQSIRGLGALKIYGNFRK